MKREKRFCFWVFCIWCLAVFPVSVIAADEGEESADTVLLMDELDLDQVQKELDQLLEQPFSIGDALKRVMQGQEILQGKSVAEFLREGIAGRYEKEKESLLQILVLVLLAAVFHQIASAFEAEYLAEIGFYVNYLLIYTMITNMYASLALSLEDTLKKTAEFWKVLAPAYFVTVAASRGAVSASVFYQGILYLIYLVQWVLLNLVLPACNIYLFIQLTDQLSGEEMLGKLAELLEKSIKWILHGVLSLFLGMQAVKSLVAPALDQWKRSALGKTASALPGIGNTWNAMTELLLSSAALVRNSFGAVCLVLLLLAGITPLIHYGFLMFAYRFLAAAVQPVSDKRMTGCLSGMGECCSLLLQIFLTVEVMGMITFLILMVR